MLTNGRMAVVTTWGLTGLSNVTKNKLISYADQLVQFKSNL
jgi:hypothetical protein